MIKKSTIDFHLEIVEARRKKQWQKITSIAQRWLTYEPNSIFALQSIGKSLEKEKNIAEASKYYEKALEIDRNERREVGHTFFLKRLDILYHKSGKFHECLRVCEYYVDRHPNSWDAWNRLRRAAQKTDNLGLSEMAKQRADEIKKQEQERKLKEKERQQKWKELYDQNLLELGFQPEPMHEQDSEPHPSYDASDEEWGDWLMRTTDLKRIDAELQALLSATAELEEDNSAGELDSDKNEVQ